MGWCYIFKQIFLESIFPPSAIPFHKGLWALGKSPNVKRNNTAAMGAGHYRDRSRRRRRDIATHSSKEGVLGGLEFFQSLGDQNDKKKALKPTLDFAPEFLGRKSKRKPDHLPKLSIFRGENVSFREFIPTFSVLSGHFFRR